MLRCRSKHLFAGSFGTGAAIWVDGQRHRGTAAGTQSETDAGRHWPHPDRERKRLTPGERDDNFDSGLIDPIQAV
jgi:hypothetical protein